MPETGDRVPDLPLALSSGKAATLGDYAGKVLLLVNVASKCGLTPQYEGLEKLYREKSAAGLEVLGFPANNFNGQEPGGEDEIKQFCSLTYDVSFPMFAKISVAGDDVHPLYRELIAAQPVATGVRVAVRVERVPAVGGRLGHDRIDRVAGTAVEREVVEAGASAIVCGV